MDLRFIISERYCLAQWSATCLWRTDNLFEIKLHSPSEDGFVKSYVGLKRMKILEKLELQGSVLKHF